jgi:condensin complex subunit 1
MLLSVNTSDVTEALRFFVQARHFQLPCAVTGMKRALALMWSSEQSIRDEVLKAFVDVFLAQPGSEGASLLPHRQIAKNLLNLTNEATVSELASIEEAVCRLVKDNRIPDQVFLIIWSVAGSDSGAFRATAFQLLAMAASADRGLIDSKSRLKMILDAGLGEFTQQHKDWNLAKAAAVVLQRMDRAKVDPSDAKYLVVEHIMEELCTIARGDWCNDSKMNDTLAWFSAAEESIKALFVISPEPETVCREILLGMSATTFQGDYTTCHPLRLARFFHVLGHISLHLLVYTEDLSSSVRRANAQKSLKKQEDAGKTKTQKRLSTDGSVGSYDDAMEEELGMDAAIEAENEKKLADVTEKEIIGRGLISLYGPLLTRVVGNEGGAFGASEVLMQSAMLALPKLMCVSSSFCEKHLPLLFTALANAPPKDTTSRSNTVVALGDLAYRFPNEVEPYTPRFYACLRDSSTKVRRHTLMVLTHLILNDMVKVKGQVCEIAICLRDDDCRIRDMSRLLFHELSKRSNNPIYNLLPDIISQLSQLSMKKDDFRGIMSFLLGFIRKERQCEMLCEKLCHRFPNCTSIDQKGDLAYCIAQLKMTDRMIKTLADNFKLYKDALHDDEVNKHMLSIVAKVKKFGKPETRQVLDDWEAKLSEVAKCGAENEAADKKASSARARASTQATKPKALQISRIDEDEELEFVSGDEETGDAAPLPPRRSVKKKKKKKGTAIRRKLKVIEDDESDRDLELASDDEEAVSPVPPPRPPAKKNGTASSRRKLKVIDDDESEEEAEEPVDKENRQSRASTRSRRSRGSASVAT